jgi:hypothetical protein
MLHLALSQGWNVWREKARRSALSAKLEAVTGVHMMRYCINMLVQHEQRHLIVSWHRWCAFSSHAQQVDLINHLKRERRERTRQTVRHCLHRLHTRAYIRAWDKWAQNIIASGKHGKVGEVGCGVSLFAVTEDQFNQTYRHKILSCF